MAWLPADLKVLGKIKEIIGEETIEDETIGGNKMGGCCVGNCCVMNNAVGDFFRDIFESGGGCGYHPGPSKTEAHAKKILKVIRKAVQTGTPLISKNR